MRTWGGYHNLEFLYTLRNKKNKDYLCSVLRKVGLDPALKRPVGNIHWVCVRDLLLHRPSWKNSGEFLILDEPMNGLDNQGVEEVRGILLNLRDEGKAIILASHNKEDIEVLCDEVYEMDHGKLNRICVNLSFA